MTAAHIQSGRRCGAYHDGPRHFSEVEYERTGSDEAFQELASRTVQNADVATNALGGGK
jgi:hypothetical protein